MTLFYKYRGTSDFERDLRIITDCNLYFSAPKHFNDPFDCAPTVVSLSASDRRDFIKTFASSNNPMINDDIKELLKRALSNDSLAREMVGRIINPEYLERHMNRYGILSLSSQRDNILLWSHYASSHTGFAIEFDISSAVLAHNPNIGSYPQGYFEFNLMATPVEYTSERPPTFSFSRELEAPFFTKSECWEYEQEYRIGSSSGTGLKPFDPSLVSAVYLGCAISVPHKDRIISVVEEFNAAHNMNVHAFSAERHPSKFELIFSKMGAIGTPRIKKLH